MYTIESFKKFIKDNKAIITLIIVIVVLSLVLVFFSNTYEHYYYNRLDKATIHSILTKDCVLTLRDYVNILNSTSNLRTIFLQDLCNNYVCEGYNPQNEDQLLGLIKTISGECIVKCIRTSDTYRLALVNLKINDMINSIPQSLRNKNYPLFKRSLTNGVYGVESVNMYLIDQKQTVTDIVNLFLEKLPKLYLSENDIDATINKLGLKDKDADIYRFFVSNFINKEKDSQILFQNKKNNSQEFSVELFNVISTSILYDLMVIPSIKC